MKSLIIVGAGGLGREVLQWARDMNKLNEQWNIKGFLDDNPSALEGNKTGTPVLGSIIDWIPKNDEVFCCAIAAPLAKENIVKHLKSKGANFTSIIHPTSIIGDNNIIGEGLIAYPYSCITTDSVVGNFVTLLISTVGHNVSVGDFTTISSYCDITGGVSLGKRVFLGSHVSIVPQRTVGNDAYIGAGSIVMTNIRDNKKVMGNPARTFTI